MKKNVTISREDSSICSNNFGHAKAESDKEKLEDVAPRDGFYFMHILFLLMGIMHFVPYTFFLTANAYWMYKFRDVNANITDTDARTTLQTHFSPAHSIINVICYPTGIVLSTFFGYKIRARLRVLATLIALSVSFVTGTIFVGINTDSWQLLFFVITMMILAVVNMANSLQTAANLSVLSRFPSYYMKVYLIGEGFGAISSSILQNISLALGTSTQVSALIYFVTGSALMTLTLALFYLSKYNKLYNYYAHRTQENVAKDVMKFSEAMAVAKQIWSPIVGYILMILTTGPIIPNVTSLVVSENYGSGSEWSDTYFVPVITYLFGDAMSLFGRITCAKLSKTFSGIPLCLFMFLRMIVMIPLVYLCNAQPRNHLPVVFHHDWQYAIILGVLTFSDGYIMNMVYLDVARSIAPEKVEDAYLVMLSCVTLSGVAFAPVGMFSVDIL